MDVPAKLLKRGHELVKLANFSGSSFHECPQPLSCLHEAYLRSLQGLKPPVHLVIRLERLDHLHGTVGVKLQPVQPHLYPAGRGRLWGANPHWASSLGCQTLCDATVFPDGVAKLGKFFSSAHEQLTSNLVRFRSQGRH